LAKIDGYYVLVESESTPYEAEVTEQPVEAGINLTDHVQRKARSLSLSGVISGAEASKIKAYLASAAEKGKLVKYAGRVTFSGVITAFSTTHDNKIADGFTFTLDLREIRIAKTSAYAGQLPPPYRVQAAKVINAGTKQVKSKKGKSASKTKEKKPTEVVKFKPGSPWAN
jgi:hypothetical protein